MTWSTHWSVLLSGAAGACISLMGVFAVFWLTTRHDRNLERARRDAAKADDARRQQQDAVNKILAATSRQAKDFTFAPVYGNAQALHLLSACLEFANTHSTTNGPVAAWVLIQHAKITRARRSYLWRAWIPFMRRRLAHRWTRELGELAGALIAWNAGERKDTWFLDQLPNGDCT